MNGHDDELVHRTNHQTDYLRVSNRLAQDYDILSAESFGWLVRFLSRPKDWRICVQSCICRHHGKSQLYRVIRELREARFIVSIEFRNDFGHRTAVANHIFDQPQSDDQIAEFCVKQAGIYMKPISQDPISRNPISRKSDTTKDSIIKRTDKTKAVLLRNTAGTPVSVVPEAVISGNASATEQAEAEEQAEYEAMARKAAQEDGRGLSPSRADETFQARTVGLVATAEAQVSFGLKSDDEPNGKDFPYGRLSKILERELPMMKMKSGAHVRDAAMKRWWRAKGKVVGSFELLAQKINASDFLMARNGHTGRGGKPYSWSWFFDKRGDGRVRADVVIEDGYSNEAMAFVLVKAATVKLTKVMRPGYRDAFEVDLNEMWNGEKRYILCKDPHIVTGLPEVIDMKD